MWSRTLTLASTWTWCGVWLLRLLDGLALLQDRHPLLLHHLLQLPDLSVLSLQANLQLPNLPVLVDALRLGHWRLRAHGHERAQLMLGPRVTSHGLLEPKLSRLQRRRCDRGPGGHVHAVIKRHICLQ